MSTICEFNHIAKKLYTWKRLYKTFESSLREYAKFITDFENKNLLALEKQDLKTHCYEKVSYICGTTILKNLSKSRNYRKVIYHCHFMDKAHII